MKISLKDYIERYLMDDVNHAISCMKRETNNKLNAVAVRVYYAYLPRCDEYRLKISSTDLIYKVVDRKDMPDVGDIDNAAWKYYDHHPDDVEEIKEEEALDLIRSTLSSKYRIEKIDKSRLAVIDSSEED